MNKDVESLGNLPGLKKVIDALPNERKESAEKLFTEIVFLESTLIKLRERIDKDGVVIKTTRTIKENPSLKAYNTTIQRYSLLFKQLIDLLPAPEEKRPADPLTDFIKAGK